MDNHGVDRPEENSDFYFVPADDLETAVGRTIELVKTRISRKFGLDLLRDIQVLCPMNRGGLGARSLGTELQAVVTSALIALRTAAVKCSTQWTRA
jgi:exodeoxyribonuclease V alpha subunit